jgi:hypothetical protein
MVPGLVVAMWDVLNRFDRSRFSGSNLLVPRPFQPKPSIGGATTSTRRMGCTRTTWESFFRQAQWA